MKEMWKAIDLLLEHYQRDYGAKLIDQMTEGKEDWYARVFYSLLSTLSMMYAEENDA